MVSDAIRKDIRHLNPEEKDRFLFSLSKLVENGDHLRLIALRSYSSSFWHDRPLYLVWHRAFVSLFEKVLQFYDPLKNDHTVAPLAAHYFPWEEVDSSDDANELVQQQTYTISTDLLSQSPFGVKRETEIPNPLYKVSYTPAPINPAHSAEARNLIADAITHPDYCTAAQLLSKLGHYCAVTGGAGFTRLDVFSLLFYANADRHLTSWQEAHRDAIPTVSDVSLLPWAGPTSDPAYADDAISLIRESTFPTAALCTAGEWFLSPARYDKLFFEDTEVVTLYVHKNKVANTYALYLSPDEKESPRITVRAPKRMCEIQREQQQLLKDIAYENNWDDTEEVLKVHESAFAERIAGDLNMLDMYSNFLLQEGAFDDEYFEFFTKGADKPPCESIKERDGKTPVRCFKGTSFTNWGKNIINRPEYIFFPRSRSAIQNIILCAKEKDRKVRCCGFRHTWNDLYSENDEWLIYMVDEKTNYNVIDPQNDLQSIEFVGEPKEGGLYHSVKIGAGTTNEMLRRWCVKNWKERSAKLFAIPFNVIMVEITIGGANAPICHGAGIKSTTLSDIIEEIEFVNALGEFQTVRGKQLRSASGAFGLLGVVVSVTMRLNKLTFARMMPRKVPVLEAVPPPTHDSSIIPPEYNKNPLSPERHKAAYEAFVDQCENEYYAEWFWFTNNEKVWVNCWRNDGVSEQSRDYPSRLDVVFQENMAHLAEIANSKILRRASAKIQTKIVSNLAMKIMPDITNPNKAIQTPVINGLHFRRGIHKMKVSDMEIEIPVPTYEDKETGKVKYDWSVCMKAWWAVIKIVADAKKEGKYPQRLCLEMRITGGSRVSLAPQKGNAATCSIEVLTICNRDRNGRDDEWHEYKQRVFDAWCQYKDAAERPLRVRSHWAKEWQELKYTGESYVASNGTETMTPEGGLPIIQYNKEIYGHEIQTFRNDLEIVAEHGGYTFVEMVNRFSNKLLREQFQLD